MVRLRDLLDEAASRSEAELRGVAMCWRSDHSAGKDNDQITIKNGSHPRIEGISGCPSFSINLAEEKGQKLRNETLMHRRRMARG